jgi:hypothetical protein
MSKHLIALENYIEEVKSIVATQILLKPLFLWLVTFKKWA